MLGSTESTESMEARASIGASTVRNGFSSSTDMTGLTVASGLTEMVESTMIGSTESMGARATIGASSVTTEMIGSTEEHICSFICVW